MMVGMDALRLLAEHRTDQIVLPTMTAAVRWERISARPELDLPIVGAMGKASSVGLGLALARPDRQVIVLDGDGSLLMNLGSLVTIAHQAPPNLVHFVLENGLYEVTGGQPIPGEGTLSFAALARAAGYPRAYEFDELAAFAAQVATILAEPGPTFVCLKVLPLGEHMARAQRRTTQALAAVRAALASG